MPISHTNRIYTTLRGGFVKMFASFVKMFHKNDQMFAKSSQKWVKINENSHFLHVFGPKIDQFCIYGGEGEGFRVIFRKYAHNVGFLDTKQGFSREFGDFACKIHTIYPHNHNNGEIMSKWTQIASQLTQFTIIITKCTKFTPNSL